MALSGVGFGAPRFYRGATAEAAPQRSIVQQSRDLSDAMTALRAPAVLPRPMRASIGAQMATLCLVQSGDEFTSAGASGLNAASAAYATVISD